MSPIIIFVSFDFIADDFLHDRFFVCFVCKRAHWKNYSYLHSTTGNNLSTVLRNNQYDDAVGNNLETVKSQKHEPFHSLMESIASHNNSRGTHCISTQNKCCVCPHSSFTSKRRQGLGVSSQQRLTWGGYLNLATSMTSTMSSEGTYAPTECNKN